MADTINAVDVQQMARKLGVTGRAVRKWIQSGKIDAQKMGNSWVIPRSEVRRVQKNRKGT
jgi:excisionase family DNA binding protein